MKAVETLLKAFDGEILANKARVKYNGGIEIVARLAGTDWVMTDKGNAIFAEYNSTQTAKPAPKKRTTKTRKSAE
jgi:hypothetical protein